MIGAIRANDQQGAVYMYQLQGTNDSHWELIAYITDVTPSSSGSFSYSLAIIQDLAIIGNLGQNTAYIYGYDSSIPTLTPSQMPSMSPSAIPSTIPSEIPSGVPSGVPSQETGSQTPTESPSFVDSQDGAVQHYVHIFGVSLCILLSIYAAAA